MSDLEKFIEENFGLIRTALFCSAHVSMQGGHKEQANHFHEIAEELQELVNGLKPE